MPQKATKLGPKAVKVAATAKPQSAPKPKVMAPKTRPDVPEWLQRAMAFAQENPAATLVGLVASALGLILLFS